MGGGDDLIGCRAGLAVSDITGDRIVKGDDILGDHADLAAQAFERCLVDILPIEADLAAVGVVESGNEIDQCGLAGTVGTDDSHGLAGFDTEVQTLQGRSGRAGIGKDNIIELDVVAQRLQFESVGLLYFFGCIQDLENTLGRGIGSLNLIPDIADLAKGLGAGSQHNQ